jgi:hypothetical protein
MSDISDTAIVTPNGDVIKLEVPKDSNIYFALQSKKWT